MHSVILVVELPNDDRPWESFLARAKLGGELSTSVQRLGQNVWQLNIQAELAPLSRILGAADGLGLTYKMLVFDAEPQWLPGNAIRKP